MNTEILEFLDRNTRLSDGKETRDKFVLTTELYTAYKEGGGKLSRPKFNKEVEKRGLSRIPQYRDGRTRMAWWGLILEKPAVSLQGFGL